MPLLHTFSLPRGSAPGRRFAIFEPFPLPFTSLCFSSTRCKSKAAFQTAPRLELALLRLTCHRQLENYLTVSTSSTVSAALGSLNPARAALLFMT